MSTIHILATTDIHGAFDSFRQAKEVKQLKKTYPEAIWIDNGDFFVGNALSTFYNTTQDISPFVRQANDFGYDVMVPGNHDLDYGLPFLKKQVEQLTMPYVCCNLLDTQDKYIFDPFTIIEREVEKVAVIGVMTAALPQLSSFEMVRDVRCKDALRSLKATLQLIPDDVDYVIVSYHGGLETDLLSLQSLQYDTGENQAYQLVESDDRIDGCIAGHQHFVNEGKIGETAFVQPGYQGNYVGHLKISSFGVESGLHHIEDRKTIVLSEYNQWLDEKVNEEDIEQFLADYFQVASQQVVYQRKGETRRDFLSSFPVPYTFSKYLFPQTEWQEIEKDREWKATTFDQDSVTVYSNDTTLPYYRISEKYIDNLFDAYHRWRNKESQKLS